MKYPILLILFFISFFSFVESETSEDVLRKEFINPKTNGRIWVYLPNDYQKKTLPIILVAPAGSRMFHGMDLSEGDTPEHIPYVKEGFAVISFDVSGPWPKIETNLNIYSAINHFVARGGGVHDARDALRIAKKQFKNINLNEVYVAGHSSAGTISLMLAQQLPNIKAAIAYAPVIDTDAYLAEITPALEKGFPLFRKSLIDASPHKNIDKYTMPVFLFVAEDDGHMEGQEESYETFRKSFQKSGLSLTYKQVKNGGHYQSMIDEGIPFAINWLKVLRKK